MIFLCCNLNSMGSRSGSLSSGATDSVASARCGVPVVRGFLVEMSCTERAIEFVSSPDRRGREGLGDRSSQCGRLHG